MRKSSIAAITAAAGISAFGVYLSNKIMFMKLKDPEEIEQREQEAGFYDPDEYLKLIKKEVRIPSPAGYDIHTVFLEKSPGAPYMIFCHGVTETKINSLKYVRLFMDKGFNAVIYDHRRHGDSGGKSTSYGHFEKNDLKAVVDCLIEEEGNQAVFGIHGESMGAVTMLLYAGSVEDRAAFYIADCPFSDLTEQLSFLMTKSPRSALLSKMALSLAGSFIFIRDRYMIKGVSPKQAVKHIQKPVLFIHSRHDSFIPSHMTETLYELKNGPKTLFIPEEGGHAQSFTANPEAYSKEVDRFLQEHFNTASSTYT
ncbi:alpha/beta hydrolase [Jeotgalibacillus haloalkalitolerans]|uniref:Alpha/beta fold hydrolase n=1 Tax=Jeotgalibacillus haloalkalitolerans TaxID=3104292 RepID=A0ABU5KLD1_9BACL|nr:alpha/beta fold hydrolase [Jeotgalibacillus sp. HH7-29]MDZ5712077.1 alpha/beta fold hydrolase [Jeotgalibacillus sp. HH7-29]